MTNLGSALAEISCSILVAFAPHSGSGPMPCNQIGKDLEVLKPLGETPSWTPQPRPIAFQSQCPSLGQGMSSALPQPGAGLPPLMAAEIKPLRACCPTRDTRFAAVCGFATALRPKEDMLKIRFLPKWLSGKRERATPSVASIEQNWEVQ